MQVEDMLPQLKKMQRAALEDEELYQLQAQLAKKFFDALKKVGFTDEQAIQLVIAKNPIQTS